MIFKEYTVTVKGNVATINEPVYLYKYDRNVELRFNVGSTGYKYTKSNTDNIITQTGASYCQIRFINEESQVRHIFDICPTIDGQAVLLIKGELIDEEVELGIYDFQIRLLDENKNSVVSLPPIKDAIHIERPLFDEVDGIADYSVADFNTVGYAETSLNTYNPDGTYNRTNWAKGDIISSAKLNKLEAASKDNVDKINELNTQIEGKANTAELEVERQRIDNLTKLPEGSTTGDAELLDVRIGDDEITYNTAGDAVRTQIKNIKDILLPSYYPNFAGRAKTFKYSFMNIAATCDSIKLTMTTKFSGNSGYDIVINSGIKSIEFDIEQMNFGINCGLYFYKDNSLKRSYKTNNEAVSSTIIKKHIRYDIDWDEVNAKYTELGANNLRLIIWCSPDSLAGGYCYASNIKINDYKLIPDINSDINYLQSEISKALKKDEIYLSDIKSDNKIAATTSAMVKWNTPTTFRYSAGTDTLTFSFTNTSGNAGFRTPWFKSAGKKIKVSGNVTSLSGGNISISLYGEKIGTQSYIPWQFDFLGTTGVFEKVIDIPSYNSQKGYTLEMDSVAILFSNDGTPTVTISDLTIEDISTRYKGEDIYGILDNLADDMSTVSFENVQNKDILIATTSNLTKWTDETELTIEKDKFTLTYNNASGNGGAITHKFTSKTTFVTIEGNITDFNAITTGAKLQLYIAGINSKTGATTYKVVSILDTAQQFKVTVDLNNLAVYQQLDLAHPIQVMLGTANGAANATVEGFKVYENKLAQADLVGKDLVETCINFNTSINQLKTKMTGISTEELLISPSGNRFIMQVNDDGSFCTVPVIPNKVMFIGNSLLLGFGDFGMCATNQYNDYYYHVKTYLQAQNTNVVCDKKLGAPYEQTETQEGLNTWIASNINVMDSDYDLVIIQLGDNVNNDVRNELFKTSCKQLIQAVRKHMPKARVVWVGEWYATAQRQEIIATSCKEAGATFIDITDLAVDENRGAIGNTITHTNGSTETVASSGVASHPGNKGMKAIADRIIEKLF